MCEPRSEAVVARFEHALLAAQREERADQRTALERQQLADEKIVDALGARTRPKPG